MNSPFFSVITPVRNGSRFIHDYVSTLKQQTYQAWEAIVVDDDSSDQTYEQLLQAIDHDSRFQIHRNDWNRSVAGPYQARNKALSLIKGNYVCFLDIDDQWLPDKLSLQAKEISRNSTLQLLYSSYYRFNQSSSRLVLTRATIFWPPQFWISILNPIPMLTACVRADAIQHIQFLPTNHEDYLFWTAVLRRIRQDQIFVHIQALAIYRVSSQSLSSNKLKAALWIYRCHRIEGKSRIFSAVVLLLRGFIYLIATLYHQLQSLCIMMRLCQPIVLKEIDQGLHFKDITYK